MMTHLLGFRLLGRALRASTLTLASTSCPLSNFTSTGMSLLSTNLKSRTEWKYGFYSCLEIISVTIQPRHSIEARAKAFLMKL